MSRLKLMVSVPVLFSASLFGAVAAAKSPEMALETPQQKLSYVIGMDIGSTLKQLGTEIDLVVFKQALEDVLEGRVTRITAEEAAQIKQAFLKQKREEVAAENKALGEKNLAEGEAFLAENKIKEGVQTTESGLQYQIIKEGDGPKPQANDTVSVHYRGMLVDGTEFDSSHQRGEPTTFPLSGVIPGWTEGLQLMSVGSTYKLFLPAKLAYGKKGAGAQIGPNATLIFEVELLEIVEK